MTSSKRDHLEKVPPSDTIVVGVQTRTYEFGADTALRPQQRINLALILHCGSARKPAAGFETCVTLVP